MIHLIYNMIIEHQSHYSDNYTGWKMEEQNKELLASIFRLTMKLCAAMKKPKKFGMDNLLYASEIHTIEIIGNHPDITITEIAERLGISKSALPKIIRKLVAKDLVYRYQEANNKKKILLGLTDKGLIAFQQHYDFHKTFDVGILRKFNALTPEEYLFLMDFLQDLEHYVEQQDD